MNHRSVVPPLQFPEPNPIDFKGSDAGIKNPKINVRLLHLDQTYEDKSLLLSQKFALTRDIESLRAENESYKTMLVELDSDMNEKINIEIDCAKFLFGAEEEIVQKVRVRDFFQQLKDLRVELTELNTQLNFLTTYFNDQNERELKAYAGLQAHQKKQEQNDLDEMDRVLKKAVDRMNGPVFAAQSEFNASCVKIMKYSKYLEDMINEERNYNFEIDHFYDDEVLPEELEALLENERHKYEVLKHRRYNLEMEMKRIAKMNAAQKKATEEMKNRETAVKKEAKEREKFRRIMRNRRIQKQKEMEQKLFGDQNNGGLYGGENEEDEKWKMITFVKEAKDEM